jgi:hypothetical protein
MFLTTPLIRTSHSTLLVSTVQAQPDGPYELESILLSSGLDDSTADDTVTAVTALATSFLSSKSLDTSTPAPNSSSSGSRPLSSVAA